MYLINRKNAKNVKSKDNLPNKQTNYILRKTVTKKLQKSIVRLQYDVFRITTKIYQATKIYHFTKGSTVF